MTRIGYTLMTEQSKPKNLVRYAVGAEEAGFDFLTCSDHYFPWLKELGHAPYAWTLLGAVAQATSRVELMTYVTCPTVRYHPAVVAQKAATLALLSDERFVLGLGSGENLNEHVVGQGWPMASLRQDMLVEAVQVIRALFTGRQVSWAGEHFRIDEAKLWDVPEQGVPIAVAVSGEASIDRFASLADHLVAVEPDAEILEGWKRAREEAGLPPGRSIGQVPICWAPDRKDAVATAHRLFRWFGGGWPLNADLPTPVAFEGATRYVREEDVADAIVCGPDLDELADAVAPFRDAGFTDVAIVQIGDESQDDFLAKVAQPLLSRLTDR